MKLNEEQIASLAPNAKAFSNGKKLSALANWNYTHKSDRAIWGEIKGSGKKPYFTQIDTNNLAYKCSCPSRQFPCKHGLALLLVYANNFEAFETQPEIDIVKEWMDKRESKSEKQEEKAAQESAPVDPEVKEKKAKEQKKRKETTFKKRFELVTQGANELEKWLLDLLRLGLLELPNKKQSEYEHLAKRMIDCKANGLATLVREFKDLDFSNEEEWQSEAVRLIARINLVIKTFYNHDQLDKTWQRTIQNIIGWSQSTKELLADSEAERVSDQWLVIGQQEEEKEGIKTQRSWLLGLNTGRTALILNFATQYSNYDSFIVPNTVIDASLAYFPSVLPYRAIIEKQNKTVNELPTLPKTMENWKDTLTARAKQSAINPFQNEMPMILKDARLILDQNEMIIVDKQDKALRVSPLLTKESRLPWMLMTEGKTLDIAVLLREDKALPLGIFENGSYLNPEKC